MSEYQNLYAQDGTYLGSHERKEPIPQGSYVHLVTVFTLNSKREILLTRRAEQKSYPLQWENTAGATIGSEDLVDAARRELWEETGIEAEREELIPLGRLETTTRNAWMHGFFLHRDVPRSDLCLQPGETVEAKWVPFDWSLCFDESLAEPVRVRLLFFWQELESFLDPAQSKDPHMTSRQRYQPWLRWAQQLQFYAQQGQAYTKDVFDRERFDGISDIAAEMLAYKSGLSPQKVLGIFAPTQEVYRTPNVEVRVAVFRNGRILMVKEKRPEKWSLPGGWCDAGLSLAENAAKEVYEEAGLRVHATRVIAVEDRSREDYHYVLPFSIYKIYVICEEDDSGNSMKKDSENEGLQDLEPESVGGFSKNAETSEAAFFAEEALPELSLARVTERSIHMCFAAQRDDHWQTTFD